MERFYENKKIMIEKVIMMKLGNSKKIIKIIINNTKIYYHILKIVLIFEFLLKLMN